MFLDSQPKSLILQFGFIDKQKLLESRMANLQKPLKKGPVTMRINRTWQTRVFMLMDQAIYFFKSEKALRSRGMIPLKDCELHEFIETDVMRMVPEEYKENCFSLRTSWKDYILYTETQEEKVQWIGSIKERQLTLQGT